MTTVAVRAGIMACDSLVSGAFPENTHKLRRDEKSILGFAGDWIAGSCVVDAYLANNDPDISDDDDVDVLLLDKTGIYLMDKKLRKVKISMKYYAIGSGSQAAMVAMNMGADAIEAIRQAIKVDRNSGAPVRHMALD